MISDLTALVIAAAGAAVVAGAVVAVSAHQSRAAILGLTVLLVAAPLVVFPRPDLLPLGARLVAAILAGYLLWVAAREPAARATAGSRLGWPVEAAAAVTAAAAGAVTAPDGALVEAQAAGFALAVLALGPLTAKADPLRLTTGLVMVLAAAGLVRVAVAGAPSVLEHLATGWLTVALAGTMAYLVAGRPLPVDGAGGPGAANAPRERP